MIISAFLAVAIVSGIVPWGDMNFTLTSHAEETSLSEEGNKDEETIQGENAPESPADPLEEREEKQDLNASDTPSKQNSDASYPTRLEEAVLNVGAVSFFSGILLALVNMFSICVLGDLTPPFIKYNLIKLISNENSVAGKVLLNLVYGFVLLPFVPVIMLNFIDIKMHS